MKRLSPDLWIKLFLCVWAAVFLWAFWAQAQPATDPAGVAPAPASASPQGTTEVWLTFGLDRVPALRYAPFAGVPLWQYIASLLFVVIAFYVAKLTDHLILSRVRKWAEKTSSKLDDLLIDLVRGPVKIVVFVILLHVGMQVYSWPDFLANLLSKGLKIVVAVSITYVALKAVDLMIGIWRQRTASPENEEFGRQLLPLIAKSLKVFVVIVALLVTSQNLGFNVTGLIASLSIGGLAIGLAAQDTLANLFGAVAVLADRPFKVGDRIRVETVDGTVEAIGFRSTRVRNLDGHLVTIPNKTMGNATITNVTARPGIKTVINIGLTYDTPPARIRRGLQIIEEIFRQHAKTREFVMGFNRFDASALNIEVTHWWGGNDFKLYLADLQEMNLQLKERFDSEGIEFAFPTQTVYVKGLPGAGSPATGAKPA